MPIHIELVQRSLLYYLIFPYFYVNVLHRYYYQISLFFKHYEINIQIRFIPAIKVMNVEQAVETCFKQDITRVETPDLHLSNSQGKCTFAYTCSLLFHRRKKY